jgi:hypothetical protein
MSSSMGQNVWKPNTTELPIEDNKCHFTVCLGELFFLKIVEYAFRLIVEVKTMRICISMGTLGIYQLKEFCSLAKWGHSLVWLWELGTILKYSISLLRVSKRTSLLRAST